MNVLDLPISPLARLQTWWQVSWLTAVCTLGYRASSPSPSHPKGSDDRQTVVLFTVAETASDLNGIPYYLVHKHHQVTRHYFPSPFIGQGIIRSFLRMLFSLNRNIHLSFLTDLCLSKGRQSPRTRRKLALN